MSWEERGTVTHYLETASVHCDCCGRMIIRLAWVASDGGEERVFCSPDCEQLYRDYWLARHGDAP